MNLFGLLTVCSPRCGFSFSIEMTAYYHPCGHWFFNDPIWLLVFQKRLFLIKESANYTRCCVLCFSGQLFLSFFCCHARISRPRGPYKPSRDPVVNMFCKYFLILIILNLDNKKITHQRYRLSVINIKIVIFDRKLGKRKKRKKSLGWNPGYIKAVSSISYKLACAPIEKSDQSAL